MAEQLRWLECSAEKLYTEDKVRLKKKKKSLLPVPTFALPIIVQAGIYGSAQTPYYYLQTNSKHIL